jgi:hypothetical protein
MDPQRRLSVLRRLLARLTGEEPEPLPETLPKEDPTPAVSVQPPPDPRERRLQLLRSMLFKLQGS